MIHTPKVSFAYHHECYFDTTYKFSKESTRYERDFRCFSCSRASSPWCPQLILSLFRSFFEQTFTKRKRTDTERVRETLKPRLKRDEYHEQHTFSLSRDVYRERERQTRETRREQKAYLERQSRVFPQRTTTNSLFYKERLCLFEYKALTENKRREIKDRKSLDPPLSVSLFRTPMKALSRSS